MADKFYLGASTAGHQVDGGEHDQWTVWEKDNAIRLASSAEKRLSWLPNWEDVKAQAGDPQNYLSGTGVEHAKHFREDFDLLKKIGLNSFRFTIEWARLEPREGEWDQAAVDYYHAYFKELRARGIEPFVNLWHWTQPEWFEKRGGFAKRSNLRSFEQFGRFVFDEFGTDFEYVFTLNEPNVYTALSFIQGDWPPQKKSLLAAFKVYRNLMLAHNHLYDIAKSVRPDLHIGIAHNMVNAQPKHPANPIDHLGAALARQAWNWWFLNSTHKKLDFIGVNYYATGYVHFFREANPKEPLDDRGWYMEPSGLETVLLRTWRRYRKPLIISETGVADAQDKWRGWWIEETLIAIKRAQKGGAEVFGYLHWSLLDNFEWSSGWWPKFGLIAVDRSKPDMPRTVRQSTKKLKV